MHACNPEGRDNVSETLAACQFEPVIGDTDANLDRIQVLASALPSEVSLAIFPELCLTGYDLERVDRLAVPIPGRWTDRVQALATDTEMRIVLGLPERGNAGCYNSTVIVSRSGVEAVYRKQYLWGEETDVFEPGDRPVVVETDVGTAGVLCCYDLNFPEVALDYYRRGCDILLVPAAWRTSFLRDWRLLCRSRARDGPSYVVGANHVGDQRGRKHAGHSLIAGPSGEIVSEADTTHGAVTAALSTAALARERKRNPVRETRQRKKRMR